jgi:hypothetical protein
VKQNTRFFIAETGDPVTPHSEQKWTEWEVVDSNNQERICLTSCEGKAKLICAALEDSAERDEMRAARGTYT